MDTVFRQKKGGKHEIDVDATGERESDGGRWVWLVMLSIGGPCWLCRAAVVNPTTCMCFQYKVEIQEELQAAIDEFCRARRGDREV